MKLWEVIKELTEDPAKVFTDGNGNCLKFTDEGLLAWHRLNGDFSGLYTFHRCDPTKWELLKQPVTWQEAIQAWAAGKIVSVEIGGRKFELMHDDSVFGPSKRMINLGTWYVED